MKTCKDCSAAKPESEYWKCRANSDGLSRYCKPCQLARNRASKQKHAEKVRAARRRAYHERHKHDPAYQAKAKESRRRLVDAKREYDREYRAKNSARLNSIKQQWREENPVLVKEIRRSYKARRRASEREGASTSEVVRWSQAAPKVCYWCGEKCADRYEVDHYEPLSRGGKHEIANLVIACPGCNRKKNAKDPLEFAASIGRLM